MNELRRQLGRCVNARILCNAHVHIGQHSRAECALKTRRGGRGREGRGVADSLRILNKQNNARLTR